MQKKEANPFSSLFYSHENPGDLGKDQDVAGSVHTEL